MVRLESRQQIRTEIQRDKYMKILLPSAVFVLMVSVGMSLRLTEVYANWQRLSWMAW